MSIIRIWKEPKAKFTWRHVVVFLYWVVTVIPMLLLIGAGRLAEIADEIYGIPRRWANKDANRHPPKSALRPATKQDHAIDHNEWSDDDYMNADRNGITQPYPPTLTGVVTDAVLGPKPR